MYRRQPCLPKREPGDLIPILEDPVSFSSTLKDKTLLIKERFEKKFRGKDIRSFYPYLFKIVDSSEMDKNVMNKTPGMAFIVPAISTFVIFECATGEFLDGYQEFGPNEEKGICTDEKMFKKAGKE